ncbi:MAG: zinc metalloprotease HtpX [Candidatus Wildermuthbacteria bacterium RIFCSPHIGHO2_01_FULL_47_27]|uniref:Protease HtpX homolog n=1 Tax=Candidatus Wildermuthbacteria bacterium RIFCSPLOWO2_01_FULL_48_35 TaxID=1802463 RepID=A0A1G2RQW1_9BACT|nr:MAG: zinc metalloprotease HtpX [Candidatus Wildermuthbacteria bacterium RIFCSPHIGHO2_01_FULL_47_27]OHA75207.1 MAG: zinc metalloprotease HtpX [Candidatus Wildermuthbacteria bacterium RIFCSPLOWO2_01_FULL_48_35]OHA75422.1 MAG: zinc metalloprotease HtpX [Candidatus Wildermuthbacteria bacterium RIFCSPLOWO2_02_FULL_47_10]
MATLYTNAESNIRKTWLYLTLFFAFIILIGWIFSYAFNSQAILWVAVILSIVSSFGSYWFSDKLVLAMSRAKPIAKEDAPELYRVVENLAITAGLPTPRIYIIEERAPNAFATGRDPKHAVVAVTRGLLERLERAELEGVLAHELSHIGNRDMLIAAIAAVLASAIVIVSDIFMRSLWFGGRRDDRRGGGAAIMLVVGLVVAILAPIAAIMLRLAISRKREFLADVSGALLTRYPEGLARALEKISKDPRPLRAANNATASLYIANPLKGEEQVSWFSKLFMTHPPVEERLKALRDMQV